MKGWMFMCENCMREMNDREDIGIRIDETSPPPEDAVCVVCGKGEEKLFSAVVNMVKGYTPTDWVTKAQPSGQPWWITGYLKENQRG